MDYLKMLYDASVVKEGHFPLRSGKHSNVYCQKDLMWQKPYVRGSILNRLCERAVHGLDKMSESLSQVHVTGPAVAASSWAAIVSDRLRAPFAYCEKEVIPYTNYKSQIPPERDTDGHVKVWQTRMAYGRGFPDHLFGEKIIVVEDIITTGSSVVKTLESLLECGAFPLFVVCIWNRSGNKAITYTENNRQTFIPVFPVIDERVDDYEQSECPMCKKGIPLDNPKTA